MLIFPRRALQSDLDSLNACLLPEQTLKLVERLNTAGPDRLAAMWEVVFLARIARSADLIHEAALPSGRRPDIAATLEGGVRVVGDITTVTDAGLRGLNPVDFLTDEIVRLARKHDLEPNHFSYRIDGMRWDGDGARPRARLSLPDKPDLARILGGEIDAFIRDIRRRSLSAAEYEVREGVSWFKVGYDSSQQYMSGSLSSFDGVSSPTQNVLANALKPKARQLRGADSDTLRLVLVCDGGCSLMRRPYNHGTRGLLHSRDVALDFLRRNSSIDAIGLVTISDGRAKAGAFRSEHRRPVELDLVLAGDTRGGRLTKARASALQQMLKNVTTNMPEPVDTPFNVERLSVFESSSSRLRGGWGMAGNSVRISTRALTQLLAGTLSHEDFMELHGWDNGSGQSFSNLFLCLLREGRRLTDVALQLDAEPDDDWITFTFDGFDAAAAPFVACKTEEP